MDPSTFIGFALGEAPRMVVAQIRVQDPVPHRLPGTSDPWLDLMRLLVVAVLVAAVPLAIYLFGRTELKKIDSQLSSAQIDLDKKELGVDATLVQPAWNIARGTLEKYWARNLNQNGLIFSISIVASALGFLLMVWGISTAIHLPAVSWGSVLAAASGALTQIIGATFLVIYRSTAQQALEFNRTLERINAAGMAWYVLETMREGSAHERAAKNSARASLATAIALAGGHANSALLAKADAREDLGTEPSAFDEGPDGSKLPAKRDE